MDEINVLDDLDSIGDLGTIRELARTMVALGQEIQAKEEELQRLRDRHRQIQFDHLPALMQSHQVVSLGLDDGFQLTLADYISASIPAPSTIEQAKPGDRELLIMRRDSAMGWLREHHHDDIIKNTLAVALPKGSDKLADTLMAYISKLKLTATRSESVHPSTLKAFVKEMLKKGTDIPFDLFGITSSKQAVCSPIKGGK